MLRVTRSASRHLLQLPARAPCSAVIHRDSPAPGLTCRSPQPAAVRYRAGVRTVSGGPAAAGGWYGGLADSAPVHLCEQVLVSVHEMSACPWWLSIAVATLSVRTVITLPLAAYQLIIISKVEALQAEISELAKRLRYEVSVRASEKGWTEKQCRFQFKKNLRRLISELYIRDNCHPFKASLLVWVQLPLWISFSLALRNLSLDPSAVQDQLAAGGALWFSDLTLPDSTWILPVCLGLTNLMVVEVFSLQRVTTSRFQRVVLNAIRVFSVVMIPIAASVPSSMALYWFTSSLVGFGHNMLLRSPRIHRLLGVRTGGSQTPYRDLLSAFKSKYWK
ncbi:cytochrome c oxidase assembly protein COX18, mitochondrial [Salarias fasciatus]|uniref:cytochrome c oxidase assembly protein COX18, mitochondrial n=1 Tax=Salarias fasciatus TaxID=181472 RepID=UPI001176B9D2|nr:cytochrome c oxidase assembly protein COX18, mitochondrial [Salarias fasciatus]